MTERSIFLILIVAAGGGVYFAVCYLLRSSEMIYFAGKIRNRFI